MTDATTPADWKTKAANQTRLAFGQALLELGAREPGTVVLSADTQDLLGIRPYIERFRERFVELGIADEYSVLSVDQIIYEVERRRINRVLTIKTNLAEATLELALAQAVADQSVRHGLPRTDAGAPIEFWVVGMGKLGGGELNVSSDIDLIYIYDADGETTGRADGRGQITVQEYFTRAVKLIYGLVGDTTEHGFVFRVDLALRPNGNSGPPVVSMGMLEEYFQVQGREWERFAWLKSRVVAPRECIGSGSAQSLPSQSAQLHRRAGVLFGL